MNEKPSGKPDRPGEVALSFDPARIADDAPDAFDGTPLLDIKPWLPSVDVPPAQG